MKKIHTAILFCFLTLTSIAQSSLDSGLVAYYPFNGNANDESGNGFNGIIHGATLVQDRFGNANSAFQFNGVSDDITVSHDPLLTLTQQITLTAWVKRTRFGIDMIVEKGGDWTLGTCNYGMSLHYINNNMFYFFFSGGWRGTSGVNDYDWHHYAIVAQQGQQNPLLYIDGELKPIEFSEGASVINLASSSLDLHIGSQLGTYPYYGANIIDDIRIYDRLLTEQEIYILAGKGLVAYYPFNGNANDESGNNINPSYIGSGVTLTSDRFGLNNRAFYFDGNDGSYIRLPADSFPTTSRTISLWINAIDLNGGKVPFCYGGNGCSTSSHLMILNQNNNSAYRVVGHCNQSPISYNYTSQPLNTWKHWVITIEGATQKLYIDGELKQTENNYTGSTYVEGRSAIIGGLLTGDGNTVYVDPTAGYFVGKIDDIRIYNHAITEQQVIELYNDSTTYTPPAIEDGLALFLPFNGNANDLSGSNNNGTVSGAALTQDRFGVDGQAYSFNGNGDYISIADNPNLFSDELTISWWYKMTEILGGERVVIGWVDGGHRYQQFFNGGQLSYLNGYNVGQPGIYFNPIYGLNELNIWKHVVVTYKKLGTSTSTTSIYVDGELKQTDNHSLAMDYAPGPDFFIGKNHNGNFFKGSLDDFRIYNRVLNNNEILALYNDSTTFFQDSLIAYFPFNGNANDLSVFANHGTVYDALLTKDRYANPDSAYYFNGSSSRIQVPQNYAYSFGYGDFTMSAWVNISLISASRIVSAGYDANDSIWGLGFGNHPVWGSGTRINYFVYSDNNFRDFSSDEILNYSSGEWIFVAASKTGNQIKFYANGLPTGAQTIIYPSNANSFMSIGCRQYSSGVLNEFLNGKIDELKIFNKSFSDEEIWDMYKATTTAPNLIFPANNSTINTLFPVMDWDSLVTASTYQIQISTDSLFSAIVLSQNSNQSSYTINTGDLSANVDYYWRVRTSNDGGIGPWSEISKFRITLTDVEDEQQLPTEFALMQNYPNPFNPSTKIKYRIPIVILSSSKDENSGVHLRQAQSDVKVSLKVFDVLGNEIATLVNEYKPAGSYEVEFSVAQVSRPEISSGIYFYQLQAGEYVRTKKMILLR